MKLNYLVPFIKLNLDIFISELIMREVIQECL